MNNDSLKTLKQVCNNEYSTVLQNKSKVEKKFYFPLKLLMQGADTAMLLYFSHLSA